MLAPQMNVCSHKQKHIELLSHQLLGDNSHNGISELVSASFDGTKMPSKIHFGCYSHESHHPCRSRISAKSGRDQGSGNARHPQLLNRAIFSEGRGADSQM